MHKSVEEFSVKTLEVAGFAAVLQALRLPFGKEVRSNIEAYHTEPVFGIKGIKFRTGTDILLDYMDIKLMETLVKRGDEHAKVLRGIQVWCEIKAPRYWWAEMDTYRVGAERLASESTMHIQGKGLSEDDLVEMKENLQESTMQRRIWAFSYQTLRRIYYQRKDHRLPQWRKFCNWIKSLPLAYDLILADGEDTITDERVSDSHN